MFTKKSIERFWSYVNKGGKDDCWNWTGYLNRDGYGNFNANNTVINAHRASYIIASGEVPAGMCVRHKCDNPSCVNPNHLLLGTQKENLRDMCERGRARSHVLTSQQVEEIKSSDKTPKELSFIFGVGGRHIARIQKS